LRTRALPYVSALRHGAIQIQVYLYLYLTFDTVFDYDDLDFLMV